MTKAKDLRWTFDTTSDATTAVEARRAHSWVDILIATVDVWCERCQMHTGCWAPPVTLSSRAVTTSKRPTIIENILLLLFSSFPREFHPQCLRSSTVFSLTGEVGSSANGPIVGCDSDKLRRLRRETVGERSTAEPAKLNRDHSWTRREEDKKAEKEESTALAAPGRGPL